MENGGDVNFLECKVKCNDFEPLAASDTAESSTNSALLEQFSDAMTFNLVLSDLTMEMTT